MISVIVSSEWKTGDDTNVPTKNVDLTKLMFNYCLECLFCVCFRSLVH